MSNTNENENIELLSKKKKHKSRPTPFPPVAIPTTTATITSSPLVDETSQADAVTLKIALGVCLGIFVLAFAIIAIVVHKQEKRRRRLHSPENGRSTADLRSVTHKSYLDRAPALSLAGLENRLSSQSLDALGEMNHNYRPHSMLAPTEVGYYNFLNTPLQASHFGPPSIPLPKLTRKLSDFGPFEPLIQSEEPTLPIERSLRMRQFFDNMPSPIPTETNVRSRNIGANGSPEAAHPQQSRRFSDDDIPLISAPPKVATRHSVNRHSENRHSINRKLSEILTMVSNGKENRESFVGI